MCMNGCCIPLYYLTSYISASTVIQCMCVYARARVLSITVISRSCTSQHNTTQFSIFIIITIVQASKYSSFSLLTDSTASAERAIHHFYYSAVRNYRDSFPIQRVCVLLYARLVKFFTRYLYFETLWNIPFDRDADCQLSTPYADMRFRASPLSSYVNSSCLNNTRPLPKWIPTAPLYL